MLIVEQGPERERFGLFREAQAKFQGNLRTRWACQLPVVVGGEHRPTSKSCQGVI
jgi:hypothetical protein